MAFDFSERGKRVAVIDMDTRATPLYPETVLVRH
nr:hypothetical protein [Salmonella enterica]